MDKLIKESEKIDLSGADIMRMCKNKVRIMPYDDLDKYDSIEQVFDEWKATIILYETRKNFGHWTLLLKKSNDTLEFFDPYGLNVDEELKYDNNYNASIHNGVIVPHLSYLISKSKYKLITNKKKLQEFLNDINTCGRWCSGRVILRDVPLIEFQKLFTNNINHTPDFWISAFTYLL